MLDEHNRELLDNLAARTRFGFAINRWEPGERYPYCEWANDIVAARTQIGRDELVGHEISFFALGNNEDALPLMRERLERHDRTPFEFEFTLPDGSTYWAECVVDLLERTPRGGYRYISETHAIDSHKELARFRDLLAATVDSEQDGVFIIRLRGENPLAPPILYTNPAFSRITGYTQEDLANGMYPRIFGTTTNLRDVEERSNEVLNGRAVVTELELYRKDGTRFWAEVRAHPLEHPTIHCALSIHDITERRRNQEAMQLLSEAVSQASDFMIVTDTTPLADGGPRVLYVNRSFLEATAYTEAEFIGEPYMRIFSPNNSTLLMTSIRNSIEAGETSYREVLARRKDGGEFWIEAVERPFVTRHGTQLRLLVGRDITHRRRSTMQLSLLFAAAEQATTPIVIYETDEHGRLTVSYENAIAARRGYYHLLELLAHDDAGDLPRRLDTGEVIEMVYERDGTSVWFYARAIRNEARLEAVLTQERFIR